MTKTIILRKINNYVKKIPTKKIPIKFVHMFDTGNGEVYRKNLQSPEEYNFIELVSRSRPGSAKYDILYAYNKKDKREEGDLYLGYWNDGIV